MLDQVHDDDIWADSDGESSLIYERNLAEKEWERLQEDHGNVKFLKRYLNDPSSHSCLDRI